jgi:dihydrofolate synthase/folylpolyglutamate synthase
VIPSKVQVLTGVGLEHTRWLGPTLADITAEKLAIVPNHGRLVTAPLDPEAESVAATVAAERHARRVRVSQPADRPLRARGGFQRANFALARAAAEAFLGPPLDEAAVRAAAAEIEIPGRLQIVLQEPLVIHDGAHNPSGARALAAALPEVVGDRPLTAVIAVLDDKDAAGMLAALLPRCERAVYTRCANPRSLSPATLESLAGKLGGPPSETVADPRRAVERARGLAGPAGAVLATGSIYLIADLVREAGAAHASAL